MGGAELKLKLEYTYEASLQVKTILIQYSDKGLKDSKKASCVVFAVVFAMK